jgi:hypothetical protein
MRSLERRHFTFHRDRGTMLNLAFIFDDAIHGLTQYAKDLEVVPLPAAVYMMQVDVINHYDHALEHYLTTALDEPYLQGSSLGTPYQKWAYFTNEDFGILSFTIHNLLRYTSRLIHETEGLVLHGKLSSAHTERSLQSREKFVEQAKSRSNSYTDPICELRHRNKSIGVMVHDDHRLSIAAVRTRRAKRPMETIQTETIDIRDRSRLVTLRNRGRVEIAELRSRNRVFAEVCDAFYQSRRVAQPFANLNASYWI